MGKANEIQRTVVESFNSLKDTQGVVSLGLFEGRLLKRPPTLFFVDHAMIERFVYGSVSRRCAAQLWMVGRGRKQNAGRIELKAKAKGWKAKKRRSKKPNKWRPLK
jgi:hypothetical protein